jgi:tRNA pseudouridine55 synthase
MHGVINLLKPPGMTSHDAVAFVRRVLKNKRVGHTGTLDPAAAGVLPICVGQATRLVEYLQAGHKSYETEATFGFETDTLDKVGTVVRQCDASSLDLESLQKAMEGFRGTIDQTPPMHSAIKVGGQKLYDLARAGESVEIPVRTVEITACHAERFVSGEQPRAWIKIECSGGTYVRSLVRDLAHSLDLVATMTFLVRTRSGHFSLENAISVEEFAARPTLTPLEEVLGWIVGSIRIHDADAFALWQGKRVPALENAHLTTPSPGPSLITNADKTILALVVPCEDDHNFVRAEKVFDLR